MKPNSSIVITGTLASYLHVDSAGQQIYNISKFALHYLTKTLAKDLSDL